jgi:two-component system KDP operon response regulator KdpE
MRRKNGLRILIIDWDPGMRRALRRDLTEHGYQVQTAETGERGLSLLKTWRPSLILLAAGPPDTSSADLLQQIRARASSAILVLFSPRPHGDQTATLDLGADDYVTKPFSIDELRAHIRVALRHARHRRRASS